MTTKDQEMKSVEHSIADTEYIYYIEDLLCEKIISRLGFVRSVDQHDGA